MTSFPGSPRVVKGGIVLLNSVSSAVERIIVLQYNPDSLTRSFQIQGMGGDANNRTEALRIKGPPVESIKLDAELDSTDQLEKGDSSATSQGLLTQLAALETIIYPTSTAMLNNNKLASSGTLEIIPMETALTLFIWNKNRILPVRITEFSVTEEAFDVNLNPIRAKVSLGMKVLSVDDLGFDQKGSSLYISYLQNKERLAGLFANGTLGSLGINSIP